MQVSKAASAQPLSQAAPLRPASEVRNTLESYLNPDADPAKSTEYGRQVSGYADFLKDDRFRASVEERGRMDDAYFATLSYDQKVAWAVLTFSSRGAAPDPSGRNDRIDYAVPPSGGPSTGGGAGGAYPTPAMATRLQAGIDLQNSSFHQELNAGIIDNLKTVDREFDAGVSTVSWADTFRARVTTLDQSYSLLRRNYEARGMDTAEITKLYEDALGKLYDYAIERDAKRSGKAAG